MATPKCPHCNSEEAFVVCTINSQMIEIMTAIKNIPKCVLCNCTSTKLRICVPCNNLPPISNENAANILHKISHTAICGECIFEQGHEEHATILISSLLPIVKNAASLEKIENKFQLLEKYSANVFETANQHFSESFQVFSLFINF